MASYRRPKDHATEPMSAGKQNRAVVWELIHKWP